MIIIRPIATEKWIGKTEFENTIAFEITSESTRTEVKKEMDRLFKAKTKAVRILYNGSTKVAIVTFAKEVKAEDIATKLKMV